MWYEVKDHWLSAALFLIYWLIVFGLDVFRWRKPENRPEDMVRAVIYLHFLLPVIAGALVSWWRRYTPGRIAGGMVAGAAVLVVDAAALLIHQWIAFHLGENGGSERISELPVFLIAIGIVGSLVGLIGAAGATGLSHLLDRWHQQAVAPVSPYSGQRVAADTGATVRTRLGGDGGIVPRRLLRVAGGLAWGAAVIVLCGVIPALAAENIARTAPRALPGFAVNAILNVLVGVALIAPVSRRGGGAGKALAVMAGFVGLLLGFALLDAASALTTHGLFRPLAAVACLTSAACDLGAGVLALVAAFRRHRTNCGGPLPVS
jgi:hypothetical protein